MADFGINFLRSRAYGEMCQNDAESMEDATSYGTFLLNQYGQSYATGVPYTNDDDEPDSYAGLLATTWGRQYPWLLGNGYTDWAYGKFAELGIKWIREWAVPGQFMRLITSAPSNGTAYTGPIVPDESYDWSVLDRVVERTAHYGQKLVLTIPYISWYWGSYNIDYGSMSLNHLWAANALLLQAEVCYGGTVWDYFNAPLAAFLADRYQNYSHIHIDPMNEGDAFGNTTYIAETARLQELVYNAVKGALPAERQNNIKVDLTSAHSYTNAAALIDYLHTQGKDNIYDGHILPHSYLSGGTYSVVSGVATINASLANAGRTGTKIRIDEFGLYRELWSEAPSAADAACISTMMSEVAGQSSVEAVSFWPFSGSSRPTEVHSLSSWTLWDYGSYNDANHDEPFQYYEWKTSIVALALTPVTFTGFTSTPFAVNGIVEYTTVDTLDRDYTLAYSTDNGANYTTVGTESPGSHTLDLSALSSGTYQVKLRITPLSGDTTPVVSEAVTLSVVAKSRKKITGKQVKGKRLVRG